MKKQVNGRIQYNQIQNFIYQYRFDFFAIVIMVSFTIYYVEVLFRPGQIVFSDIDFPFNSASYMDEVFGIWNTKWNTTSMLNIPRLIVLLPSYLLAKVAADNGNLFLKSFVVQNLVVSGIAFYLFCKRLVSIYISHQFNMSRIFVIIFGSLYYALNPWVIFRIQHIYLLVGYSFFPLILLLFFKIFDHKFQKAAITNYNPFDKKLSYSNVRDIIFLAYIITIASAAIHYFFYTLFLLAPILGLLIIKYSIKYRKVDKKQRRNMWINILKKAILLGIVLACFSFYWLFIYIGSILFGVQASQNNINVIDTYVAFSRNSSLKEVIYFISYWWTMIDMRQLPIWFYIGGAIILITSFVGLVVHVVKHHIILFMGVLSVFLIVFSTGVHYPPIAKFFLFFTELPIIGSIFRDPNKLVALLAMFLAIFFVFGLEFFLKRADKVLSYRYIVIYSIVVFAALSLMMYLMPMKTLYFEHFYAPIEQPLSYTELVEFQKDKEEHYGIYLPLADEMIQPYSRVSTPYWNINQYSELEVSKATGDVHIYNSTIPTLFQFEGNDPTIFYYFNYLQYLLDQGRTNQMYKSFEAFGGDQLIYHDEYLQQFYRQDFNLEVLQMDEKLENVFKNNVFTVFTGQKSLKERNQEVTTTRQVIHTPYGFERTEIYKKMELYNPLQTPIIYLNQKKSQAETVEEISFWTKEIPGFIEAKNEYDIIFSKLPEKYYLYPFEWTNQGNVFLGWSKTFMSSVDWSWYLESQDMKNRSFEFDRSGGVAVTFASKKLDIQPYLRDTITGKLIMDFDTMLRTENLFVPDNPDLFEINSNPYSEIREFQTLHGELIKGNPKNIWQVAKSGVLEANGGTPYYFELLISGRDVDRLHLKVRFYDENNEEIGVSYIVGSTQESYFDTIKFIGEVISPSKTAAMRMDLLSFQNPEFKSYWWIHDINIYDLSQYVKENKIQGEYEALTTDDYDVYIRTFNSNKGGELQLDVGEESFILNTLDQEKNAFAWHYLGMTKLQQGKHPIYLNGKDGFNGVNAIVILPHRIYEQAKEHVSTRLKDKPIIMSYESSTDLKYSGNIQSERIYPSLSMGKGIALQTGEIHGEFDVLNADEYTIYPNIQYVYKDKGYGKMTVYKNGDTIASWLLNERIQNEEKENIVEYTTNSRTYPYSFLEIMTPYRFEDNNGYNLELDSGHYRFKIELISETPNQSLKENIKPFDPSIIRFPPENTQVNDQGSCERITPDMMRESVENDTLKIIMDPTCSTDWYSYGSNKIDVEQNQELLIRFDARSQYLKNRHAKVLFLDDANYFKGEVYINEVEEQYKKLWNHYEQLVKVPKDSTKMIIQFLGNGDRENESLLEIKDYGVYNYNEFIALDHMFIENKKAKAMREAKPEQTPQAISRQVDQFGLNYIMERATNEPVILNTYLSPNKNWRLDGLSSDLLLNGITQGFIIQDKAEIQFELLLMPGYLVGLGIHVLSLLVCGIWLVKKRKHEH